VNALGVERVVPVTRSSISSASRRYADWLRSSLHVDEGLAPLSARLRTLHDDGLIYRGIAMVNWCHTAHGDFRTWR